MNEKMKTYLSNIASACILLQDSETNILNADNDLIQASIDFDYKLLDRNKIVRKEREQADNIRKAILENHDLILWEMFGQSAVTINKETVEANKATVSKWADERQLRKGHHKVLDVLELRGYPVTIKTLRRETGLMIPTIYSYIHALRQEGHQIATLRKGRANPKFQLLAKAV